MLRKIKNAIMHYFYIQLKYVHSLNEETELHNLKKQFKSVGLNFYLGKDYSVLNPEFMEFGDGFGAKERFRIQAILNYEGQKFLPNIKIGKNVIFNTDIHIGCVDQVEIGDNCLFASRIYITDHDHGATNLESLKLTPVKRKLTSKGPVIIKDNVWVGEGVAILSGVTIGENCIIATNAVVTKSFPPNVIIGGIPAKILKIIKS
jgi:acetyltransferase-like isoleucine patch superfamily enzyme